VSDLILVNGVTDELLDTNYFDFIIDIGELFENDSRLTVAGPGVL